MAPKKDKTLPKKKDKYRIRNWREYNQSLYHRMVSRVVSKTL
jgi:hypothetical protein